jgi:hypothetical protein
LSGRQSGRKVNVEARESTMIDVKGAVKVASSYLRDLYDKAQIEDVLLEEVRQSDDERYWLVTMGFSRPIPPSQNVFERALEAYSPRMKREYKVFEIDSTSGDVRAMRIREA